MPQLTEPPGGKQHAAGNSKAPAMPDLDALCRALAVLPALRGLTREALVPLETSGIAHDHVRVAGARIDGRGVLARIPRLSQWGAAPEANLAYQAACFARAEASGHTPRLFATLPVSDALPWGALVVEEIAGAKPRLPGGMAAIARCLAALHGLPPPAPGERPPLQSHDDPAAAILAVIEEQAGYLDDAGLAPAARAAIEAELAWAREFCDQADTPDPGATHGPNRRLTQSPIVLVSTDSHPGNFLLEQPGGRAVLVDLEKMLYGSPAIDLAHATLYTSTRWDPDCAAALSPAETASFYRAYLDLAGAEACRHLRPLLTPMRRLTWLRTTTWCGRWRVLSRRAPADGPAGGWSAALLAPDLRAHIEANVADYFDPDTIARITAEWRDGDGLAAALDPAA